MGVGIFATQQKDRFRVNDLRSRLPEIGTGARTSQYASDTVRFDTPTVPAGAVRCVGECTRENAQYNDDAAYGRGVILFLFRFWPGTQR